MDIEIKNFNINKKYNYIIHLADIHIRNNLETHLEYESIFNNLIANVKTKPKLNKKNTCVIISGDIFNDARKDQKLSPNAIQLFKLLIKLLKHLGTLIIIPGNHDNNITFQYKSINEKIDALSSVMNSIKGINKHIFYLKHTGKYILGNLLFYHTSVFDIDKIDKPEQYHKRLKYLIKKDNNYPNHKHIGLFHCGIEGQKIQNGYMFMNYAYKLSDINQYDITCLGDTHKLQFLGKNKNIAYPSSLIQQNFGESLNNHGYILWNLNTLKGEFYEIKNEYGFVTITPETNINNIFFPKYSRIKLKYTLDNLINIPIIKKQIKIKTNIIKWITSCIINKKNINIPNTISVDEMLNSNEDIKIFLENKFPKNENKINKIFDKIKTDLKSLDKNIPRLSCELIHLKFNNFQNYKNSHYIDFTKYNKFSTIAINGKNTYGKSTLIRALGFSIWGSDKGKCFGLINNNSKSTKVELIFKHNNQKYKIIRILKYNKPQELKLEKLINNLWKNISVKSIKTNQKTINKYFGTKSDAKQTWFSEQGTENQFINSNNNYNIFQNYIGADNFKDIHVKATKNKKIILNKLSILDIKLNDIGILTDKLLLKTNIDKQIEIKIDLIKNISKLETNIQNQLIKKNYGTLDNKLNWEKKINNIEIENIKLSNSLSIVQKELSDKINNNNNNINLLQKNKDILNKSLPIIDTKINKNNCKLISKLEKNNNKLSKYKINLIKLNSKECDSYSKINNLDFNKITSKIGELKVKIQIENSKFKLIKETKILIDKKNYLLNKNLDLSNKHKYLTNKLKKQNNDLIGINSKLNNFKPDNSKLTKYNLDKSKYIDKLKIIFDDISKNTKLLDISKNKLFDNIPTRNQINNGLEKLNFFKNQLSKINNNIIFIKKEIKLIKNNLNKNESLIFNDKCNCCDKNKKYFKIDELNENVNKLENQLLIYNKKKILNEINIKLYNNYELLNNKFKINLIEKSKIQLLESKLINLSKDQSINKNKIDNIINIINNYNKNLELYNSGIKIKILISSNQIEINEINKTLDNHETIKKSLNKLKNKLQNIDYSPDNLYKFNLKYDILTKFHKSYNKKIKLEKNIEYNTIIIKIEKIKIKLNKLKDENNSLKNILEQQNKNNICISKNKNIIDIFKKKIEDYNKKGGYNKSELENFKKTKLENEIKKNEIIKNITTLEIELKYTKLKMKNKTKLENEIIKLKLEYEFLKDYCDIVDPRNGYPQKFITSKMDLFEYNINNFINSAGFDYVTKIQPPQQDNDSKKQSCKLIFQYIKNQKYFYNLSGAEKLIFNIAVQTSLGALLHTTIPPIQIIDEGFSSLDKDHIYEIPKILNAIKSRFNLILYISHNEFIKNGADYVIEIDKSNGNSLLKCL